MLKEPEKYNGKWTLTCPQGHVFEKFYSHILYRLKGCPICRYLSQIQPEREIYRIMKKIKQKKPLNFKESYFFEQYKKGKVEKKKKIIEILRLSEEENNERMKKIKEIKEKMEDYGFFRREKTIEALGTYLFLKQSRKITKTKICEVFEISGRALLENLRILRIVDSLLRRKELGALK